jgi:arylsulfatase A-like enzyme
VRNRTTGWISFVLLGISAGVFGGLLEGAVRLWLQLAGATNFEMRLTALSTRVVWVTPLSYGALFGLTGLLFVALERAIRIIDWHRVAVVLFATLACLPAFVASGRIANISALLLALGLGISLDRLLPRVPDARIRRIRATTPWLIGLAAVTGFAVELNERQSERHFEAALPPASPNAPNILLIVLDTLRADHLPSYGYPRSTAPALKRVAEQGIQFDRTIAASSWSLPSHVSLLTGRYPREHGAHIDRYDGRFQTLGSAFLEHGYSTAVISANSTVFSRAQGFGPGFVSFDDSFYSPADAFTRTIYGKQIRELALTAKGERYRPVRRSAESVTRAARGWIAAHRVRPFFLMLNYFDMHDPWPSIDWRDELPLKASVGPARDEDADDHQTPYSVEDIRTKVDAYDSTLMYVDRWLSELFRYLDDEGLSGNTAVVVTSDHGEALGQHRFMFHGGSLHIEQIHVPLIIRFPGRIPAGVRVPTPVSHTSIPNTILELADVVSRIQFPGTSLGRFWKDPGTTRDWPLPMAELKYRPWRRVLAGQDSLRSLVDSDWHYIEHSLAEPELFNLNEDAGEVQNVAKEQRHQDLIRRYQAVFDGLQQVP